MKRTTKRANSRRRAKTVVANTHEASRAWWRMFNKAAKKNGGVPLA